MSRLVGILARMPIARTRVPGSMVVHTDLCPCRKPRRQVFSRHGSKAEIKSNSTHQTVSVFNKESIRSFKQQIL